MMTGALTPENGGSGEADVRDSRGQVQARRERAAHYRKYAAQFRALAASEQNESLREKLMQIVHQYEEQARDLDPKPG
jgi:ribose 1,5-bisphosphokinase PhnN